MVPIMNQPTRKILILIILLGHSLISFPTLLSCQVIPKKIIIRGSLTCIQGVLCRKNEYYQCRLTFNKDTATYSGIYYNNKRHTYSKWFEKKISPTDAEVYYHTSLELLDKTREKHISESY